MSIFNKGTGLFILGVLMLPGTESRAATALNFNSVRIVHFDYSLLCDALLDRAKANNYNYAVIPFTFRASNETVGDGDVYANLRTDVRNAAVALNKRGMRLIPMVPMSSKWAIHWKILQKYENPNIGMNTITSNDNNPDIIGDNPICNYKNNLESVNKGSNSWAYEPDGVDKSIIDVFKAVNDGFNDANVGYILEYIHLEHDEPQFLNWNLMAGVGAECETAYPYKGNFARGAVSKADVQFIQSLLARGYSTGSAYQQLLANELFRRISQVEQVFGSRVKSMIFGESFDDQSWGGVPWWVNFGNSNKMTMSGVIDLPGLNDSQRKKMKERLILVVWNYDGKNPYVARLIDWLNQADYNSENALNRLTVKGYKFLYLGALENGDDSKQQINEYASASRNYQNNCLGYYAAAWDVGYTIGSPDGKWNILEYLYSGCGNNKYMPVPAGALMSIMEMLMY